MSRDEPLDLKLSEDEYDEVRALVAAICSGASIFFDEKLSERFSLLLRVAIREASKKAFVVVERDDLAVRVTSSMPLSEI